MLHDAQSPETQADPRLIADAFDFPNAHTGRAPNAGAAAPRTQTPHARVHEHTGARVAPPVDAFAYKVIKRTGDLLLVLVALPLLLPVLFVIGTIIRFDSPGPVFFSHRRICRNGAFFSMWKFRTMCINSAEVLEHYLSAHPEARAEWNRTHKLKDDPRITSIGRFLRKSSLDELPQLWNVITGRMSLIGPRPIVAAEVEKYGQCFACYCAVKPGVTGLWQVSGRSRLTYDERVGLDCEYVQRWSLTRDLRILLATAKSVINKDGAY